jgi:CelD/BcsL family acetyltransferase involved in cellulose biosynthesis
MTPASEAGIREFDLAMCELLARHEERPVFLHPVWLRAWLAEFGDGIEPVLLECSNSATAAVAPLMRNGDGRLTFIGDPEICDFMDFVVDPDCTPTVYARLWAEICSQEWNDLILWGLMAKSQTLACVSDFARSSGYEVHQEREAVAPRLDLPGTWDEYLASLSKKDRHELRRKMRRVMDSGASVDLHVYSEPAEVEAAMDAFLELHTRSRLDKTEFMTDAMESFFRRMASAMACEGLVRLFMLNVNSKPAATVFCFDAGSHLYMYNSGYDPDLAGLSVGLVSKALCLRWAIENGKKGLDFLRGNEPYKYDLGAKDQEIYRLVIKR